MRAWRCVYSPDYVERFKLNDRVVSKAIRELSESGVLQKRFVDGGLGKRRRCLELEPQLEEALVSLESEQPVVEPSAVLLNMC